MLDVICIFNLHRKVPRHFNLSDGFFKNEPLLLLKVQVFFTGLQVLEIFCDQGLSRHRMDVNLVS